MVIDDDLGVGRAFSRLLGTLGHQTVVYGSGQAVLSDPSPPRPALILLDLQMPGISGVPLMLRLRERWPGVPIVVMTGLDHPLLAEKMIAAGATAFLSKPVSRNQIVGVLESREGP
jgi:FixJ family two-component response regulator